MYSVAYLTFLKKGTRKFANYTQINWEAGKRYIYSITMRSNDAEIGGENGQSVTIEPWGASESDVTLVLVK